MAWASASEVDDVFKVFLLKFWWSFVYKKGKDFLKLKFILYP